jgi:hypothetical protein
MLVVLESLVVLLGLFRSLAYLKDKFIMFHQLIVHCWQASLPWHVRLHRCRPTPVNHLKCVRNKTLTLIEREDDTRS